MNPINPPSSRTESEAIQPPQTLPGLLRYARNDEGELLNLNQCHSEPQAKNPEINFHWIFHFVQDDI